MMELQTVLVFLSVGFATAYLVRKFVFPPKKKVKPGQLHKGCGPTDCSCH